VTASAHATLQSGESAERGARRAGRHRGRLTATGHRRLTDLIPSRSSPPGGLALQELVPIRYGRMLVSPFTFYRGAAAVMAADLAATPDSGIVVQACGDAHISNFGDSQLRTAGSSSARTTSTRRSRSVGVDVKRMAASAEIAGRDVGLPEDRRRRIVTACVREYREGMRGFANESHLDVVVRPLNASELVDRFGGN